ncbi:uncharacterized protein IUM83_01564 [Phytophthora cinnamomi]|uniref:uncharacterized protein n=1 Tax=Phytophthora cinnamomi TaxID=4785 RepID=UPI002A27E1FC|nr:hypothetical protein IUM83_01564 [Phytophthora cinnamomi]KAJ8524930.1 hypothetical protein ON010_g16185 [Phytophthora cinnamomi]
MPPALEAKDGGVEATRGPERVDKVWDEQVDGAWAPGKAPVSLLMTLLKCVQERDSVEAERAAREILEVEPNNRLVQDLLDAMKQHDAMEAAAEAEEGSSGEEEDDDEGDEDDEDEDDEDSSEDEEDEEQPDSNEVKEHDSDAKNNDGD